MEQPSSYSNVKFPDPPWTPINVKQIYVHNSLWTCWIMSELCRYFLSFHCTEAVLTSRFQHLPQKRKMLHFNLGLRLHRQCKPAKSLVFRCSHSICSAPLQWGNVLNRSGVNTAKSLQRITVSMRVCQSAPCCLWFLITPCVRGTCVAYTGSFCPVTGPDEILQG